MYEVVKKAIKDLKIGDDIEIHRISDIYRVMTEKICSDRYLKKRERNYTAEMFMRMAQSCTSVMSFGSFQIKFIFLENGFYISNIFF